MSIAQEHPEPHEPLRDGLLLKLNDATGDIERSSGCWKSIPASHDTAVSIRSDGHRVELSGNIGRLGRPDNVFGYSVLDCVGLANRLLGSLGLPPFTPGVRVARQARGAKATPFVWTGATLSRLDLTRNHAAGSAREASDALDALKRQKISRKEPRAWENTVCHGSPKYIDRKAYLKGVEIRERLKALRRSGKSQPPSRERVRYLEHLADWCDRNGLVRIEPKFSQRALDQKRLRYLGDLSDELLGQAHAKEEMLVLDRLEGDPPGVQKLKPAEAGMYHAYMRGVPGQSSGYSRRTRYRHRAAILAATGVDVFGPVAVEYVPEKPRRFNLRPIGPPDFYREHLAA
ncbi:phage/plasmid replication domain-containing protein [Rubrivirga sp.]|uniref:phage/plasmid replication domain-containing protein n=1 Tax=Rubrivirga sp. TaxID=1885344 RepID=UPI003C7162FC